MPGHQLSYVLAALGTCDGFLQPLGRALSWFHERDRPPPFFPILCLDEP